MTPEQHRYLFVQTAVGAAVVNAVLNGAIGWAITRGLPEFPVWSVPGVAFDLVATAFGVAFGTCFGALLQVWLDVSKGRITPPASVSPALGSVVARFPRGTLRRSVALGLVAVPLFSPPVLLLLGVLGEPALGRTAFIALKAGFSAVEGAIVTPFIVLAALLDTVDARPPA